MDPPSNNLDKELAETAERESEFVGLSQPDAEALATRLGLELRVVTPDDDWMTADCPDRRRLGQ